MLCHNFFLEDIAQVLGGYWGKSSTVSWRIFLSMGGYQPNRLLEKKLRFSDADPVGGLSRSDAVVVFAFVWSYSDLGNNGHSWPMMMRMMMPMTI